MSETVAVGIYTVRFLGDPRDFRITSHQMKNLLLNGGWVIAGVGPDDKDVWINLDKAYVVEKA